MTAIGCRSVGAGVDLIEGPVMASLPLFAVAAILSAIERRTGLLKSCMTMADRVE